MERDSLGRFKKGYVPKHKGNRTYTNCKMCGLKVRSFKSRPKKFCTHSCATKYLWESGELQKRKKVTPWNKGLKGIHLSPSTEFKYQGKGKLFKGKSQQYWRQQARRIMGLEKNDRRVVHHVDGDITNNQKGNLKVMGRAEHTKLHHSQGDIHRGD